MTINHSFHLVSANLSHSSEQFACYLEELVATIVSPRDSWVIPPHEVRVADDRIDRGTETIGVHVMPRGQCQSEGVYIYTYILYIYICMCVYIYSMYMPNITRKREQTGGQPI